MDVEANQTGTWDAVYRVIHRDGSVRWLHSLGKRSLDAPPGTVVWHGVGIDVTARVEAWPGARCPPRGGGGGGGGAPPPRDAGLAPPV
jgi:hypothetical protein